jgi:hypothetical protein
MNTSSFGLMNETQNENMSMANGNFDLDKASNAGGDECVSELEGWLKNKGNQDGNNLGNH